MTTPVESAYYCVVKTFFYLLIVLFTGYDQSIDMNHSKDNRPIAIDDQYKGSMTSIIFELLPVPSTSKYASLSHEILWQLFSDFFCLQARDCLISYRSECTWQAMLNLSTRKLNFPYHKYQKYSYSVTLHFICTCVRLYGTVQLSDHLFELWQHINTAESSNRITAAVKLIAAYLFLDVFCS